MTTIWYDSIGRVGEGKKRHIYEEKGGGYVQLCGGDFKTDSHGLVKTGPLALVDDPNACIKCMKAAGLHELIKRRPNGADHVEYDPFEVFGKPELEITEDDIVEFLHETLDEIDRLQAQMEVVLEVLEDEETED